MEELGRMDPELVEAIDLEIKRQHDGLELIPSENYVSKAILEATGTILTNKYAEGYPRKRYYGGCVHIDTVEQLAIDRLKKLFNCDHANVQPHSGSNANMGVYFAVLKAGDRIMGMDLFHGGHLTHGFKTSFSGKLFHSFPYTVDPKTELINYDELKKQAKFVKPKLIIAGASAYPRLIDFRAFKQIADEVGAMLMVDIAHIAGLIVAGEHPSPIPYADFVTSTTHKTLRGPRAGVIMCKEEYAKKIDKSIMPGIQGGPLEHVIAAKAVCFKEASTEAFKTYQRQIVKNAKVLADTLMSSGLKLVTDGTDNHLMLINLSKTEITGKDAETALEIAGITVNKNTVPFDQRSPFITSGIRIGTPAITTRGMNESEMKHIGEFMVRVLKDTQNMELLAKIKQEVKELCDQFPLPNSFV